MKIRGLVLASGLALFCGAHLARAAAPTAPLSGFNLADYERPRLIAEAEAVLTLEPKTIVAAINPRSAGGPHDWSSEADYFWPNPKNPAGPYINRDGMTNPDNFVAHRALMLQFVRAFGALAAAYEVTGDERYAAAAVRHLHAWFVDPATRMNPNLQYSQAIRGLNTGRGIGVIDTVHFAEVARGIEVLRGSASLSPAEDAAVTGWFRDYLHWMRTSANGIAESKTTNNHGTCWVLQAAAFAQLVGDQDGLAACRKRFEEDLLPRQMGPDGGFPRELARTKPYGYSIFNLDVMTALAQLLSRPGENLLDYTLADGRSLIKGVAFLYPFIANKAAWPKAPDAMYWNDWPVRQPALIFGALAAGRADWLATWEKLDPDPTVAEIRRNFPIRQPVLWVNGLARPEGRLTLSFNPGWKFIKADPPGASSPTFDDSGWTTISTPHTYNDTDTFIHWSNRGMTGETGNWGGRTWYRKSFAVPPSWAGRRVFIEFEAVRQVGEVYLNGHRLGVSKNGFIPFGFDLTPYLRLDGGANVLAVMCDNRFMRDPVGESNLGKISAETNAAVPDDVDQIRADQIPWNNARWHPPLGGIYRNVFLHVADPLHITLPLYDFLQTAGPYVYATDISEKSAELHLEVPVENGRPAGATVALEAQIFDFDGRPVLSLRQDQLVAAGATATFQLSGSIASPKLWEPDYPHLYRAVCTLRVNGATVDSTSIPFGVRSVRWTADAGFFINGHHLKLHGWGQRPTDEWPGLGTAQPDWLHFYTLALTKQAGSNFERWGHSAGGPAMITAGDQLGLATDQPGVDGESDTVGAAWKIRVAAWRDAIIYYRNHPSIVLWEAGNQKVSRAHAIELRAIEQQYDSHGGRAVGYRRADQTDAQYMDVGVGTEGGREIAKLPVVEGEYDREESPRRIWDRYSPPDFGYPGAADQSYPPFDSEEFAVHQVAQYVRKLGAASHSGGANWIFSDSTSGGRVDCETARDSGEVDGVRLPKEAYYVCSVMFNRTPGVHIIGHWNYPAGTRKTVYVAANGDAVELFVNGKSLGRGKLSDRYLFAFPDVAWEPGEIKAVAYAKGAVWATESKHTVGAPVALRLTPIVGPVGWQADGADIALVDVEAVDAHGERCPTFQQRVDFTCDGPAVWRGGWNSGKVDSTNNLYLDLECGINRVSIRSSLAPGRVAVRAQCAGLKPADLTLESLPVAVANGCTTVLPVLPGVSLPAERPVFEAEEPAAAAAGPSAPAAPAHAIRNFLYSGTVGIAHVESDAQDGRNIYVDRDLAFEGLPASLRAADWVQAGQADALYSALDFIVIAVSRGATVTVAHDDRLPLPEWLVRQFQPTPRKLTVNGQPMSLFVRRAAADETLTLGSNTEATSVKSANMYVVFVKAHGKPSDAAGP